MDAGTAVTEQDIEQIRAARALITPRERWIRGQRHHGDRHCAVGALEEVAGITHFGHLAQLVVATGATSVDGDRLPITSVNDIFGHDAALTMFDIAADRLHALLLGRQRAVAMTRMTRLERVAYLCVTPERFQKESDPTPALPSKKTPDCERPIPPARRQRVECHDDALVRV